MSTATVDAATIRVLGHKAAIALQHAEIRRTLDLLRALDPADWSKPTDCVGWDVRRLTSHVVGQCAASASPFVGLHQLKAARKRRRREGGPLEASISAIQVAEREPMTPGELIEQLAKVGPRAANRRRKLLGWFRRHMKVKSDRAIAEKWTLGYLVDIVALRDLWMHRIDLSRATGRPFFATPEHDGPIVADVVRDWAGRHRQPFNLVLLGPGGGWFASGSGGGPRLTIDAVEFCRSLSGRASHEDVLAPYVPF